MALSLFGIGALLQSEDGYCKIKELKPGPAMRSGKLKENDASSRWPKGDQEPVDVVDMKLGKVVERSADPKRPRFRLTVIPADAPDLSVRKVVALIRDEIKLEDQKRKPGLSISLPPAVERCAGVIDLPSFYAISTSRKESERKSTTADVKSCCANWSRKKLAASYSICARMAAAHSKKPSI
jgi:carboxyl-terminal processing protease